ncbi:MAG: ribosomal protein S18-alanine N-acetyltransferase [Pyrinomonadaceae bacterium]|nr:ribosomal protein S18-alanine N-acetyltransferase [Pyrinomonadaceae bacterium]
MIISSEIGESEFEIIAGLSKSNELGSWNKTDYQKAYVDSDYVTVTAKDSDCIIGFIIFRVVQDEVELLNICVENIHRRKGTASILINYCIDFSLRQKKKKIWLEVRESNFGAIKFYQKSGFYNYGTRKKYYSNPVENALIMVKTLSD